MDEHEAEAAIRRVLGLIAPEADLDDLGPQDDLADTLDLDSMDFLNLMIGLGEATGIEIPESEYPRVRTMAGCIAHLTARARGG